MAFKLRYLLLIIHLHCILCFNIRDSTFEKGQVGHLMMNVANETNEISKSRDPLKFELIGNLFTNGSKPTFGNEEVDRNHQNLLDMFDELHNKEQDDDDNISVDTVLESIDTTPRYTCNYCAFPKCTNRGICNNAVRCFHAQVKNNLGEVSVVQGCIGELDHLELRCTSSNIENPGGYYFANCCEGNFCNNDTIPLMSSKQTSEWSQNWVVIMSIGGGLCTIIIILLIVILRRKFLYRKKRTLKSAMDFTMSRSGRYKDDINSSGHNENSLKELLDHDLTSESGSGLPLLVQRTVAKQVHLAELIGRGRYGEVWRGIWQGENVAVKNFFTRDEGSWRRETEIYNTVLLCHDNILGYLGSDVISRGSCTQLWLLTQYHPDGSLYDYLNINTINHTGMFKIIISILNGLLHLHYEILGTKGKPAIAHRDIKSKNILMKSNGTCVIADFGLAVKLTSADGFIDLGENPRAGTRRYMPPEILNETIDQTLFENFRKVDMYAMALVMWETCQRCYSNGIAEDYLAPYADIVPSDPSFEEMKKIVCIDNYRPIIPNRWSNDVILAGMTKIIRECWHQNPNVRLTSLRVKKSVVKLSEEDPSIKVDLDL